jgi:hypothetical protein
VPGPTAADEGSSICTSTRRGEGGEIADVCVCVSTIQNRVASTAPATALATVTMAINLRARARRSVRRRRDGSEGGGSSWRRLARDFGERSSVPSYMRPAGRGADTARSRSGERSRFYAYLEAPFVDSAQRQRG